MKAILLVFLFYPLLCFSQNNDGWYLVAESSTGSKNYVKNIKEESANNYSLWVKTVYPSKKYKNKKGLTVTKAGKYDIVRWKIYCSSKEYAITQSTSYSSEGVPINSFEENGEIKEAIPDSVGERIIQFVCDPLNLED